MEVFFKNHYYTCGLNMHAGELYDHLVQSLTLDVGNEEKQAIIRWLLLDRLALSAADVRSKKVVNVSPADFDEVILRLNRDEPLQYILGNSAFYGRTFEVSPAVLIPRPETELLVSSIIDSLGNSSKGSLLDIGTGSGCIAITLALELPHFKVTGTDVDLCALEVARRNASQLRSPVEFLHHDILREEIPYGDLDAVVSNPPYIRHSERSTLAKNVIDYEPELALFVPDIDPFLFHRAISEKAKDTLKPGGLLLLEINERLAVETVAVIAGIGFRQIVVLKDLDKKDRFISGRSPE